MIGQVGINTPLPEPSSSLELRDLGRGFIPTRMTSAERENLINLHGTLPGGIFLFDTNEQTIFFYNPSNLDGNNAGGDQNWQMISPFIFKDNKSDFQAPEFMRIAETHRTVKNVHLFANTLISSIRRLFIKGSVSISNTNSDVTPENYGIYAQGNSSMAANLSVNNTLTAGSFSGIGAIPVGGIILWSGTPSNVPTGWTIFSNASDRFVLGSSSATVSTGGSKQITLSIAQMPSHNHAIPQPPATEITVTTESDGDHTHTTNAPDHYFDGSDDGASGEDGVAKRDVLGSAGNHTHSFTIDGDTSEEGSGNPINIMPRYVSLFYIKRIF